MARALIIGGSMSGLIAALALARRGWQVDVFERTSEELAGRGAGIVAQPPLKNILRILGLDPDTGLGVEVATRQVLDLEGQIIATRECRQTFTSWDRVFHLLEAALPTGCYHRGKELRRVEDGARAVIAYFSDGTWAEGDVLIGADGIRSTTRTQYWPQAAPLYAGYSAWRGLVPETAFPPALHAVLFDFLSFCLPANEQMLGYPVAGPDNDLRPGQRRYNFVWYRPADEAVELPRLLTDEGGRTHALSIPPPLIASAVIGEMRAASERTLAPQFREIVRLTGQPFLQPIYDLEVPRMAFGRVALIGDAAFVARPHIGAGVSKGGEDAMALADELAQGNDVEAALLRFESARIDIGRRIVARARHLGAYVQAERRSAEEEMLAERHRTPQAVLAETASLDFLSEPEQPLGVPTGDR